MLPGTRYNLHAQLWQPEYLYISSRIIYGCSDSFFPFNEGPFNEWDIQYPRLSNNPASNQWEPLRINNKQKSHVSDVPRQYKPHQWSSEPQLQNIRPTHPLQQQQLRSHHGKPATSWWSYDCRFQDYGPYSSFHVMCYFLGPSFVHYHDKRFTTFL